MIGEKFDEVEYKTEIEMNEIIKMIKNLEEVMRSRGKTDEDIDKFIESIPEFCEIFKEMRQDRGGQGDVRGSGQAGDERDHRDSPQDGDQRGDVRVDEGPRVSKRKSKRSRRRL